MAYQYGGLFQAFCDDSGNLDRNLLRKAYERDDERLRCEELELEFWRLYNFGDFNSN